jgi:Holliday junction DNA helicase RuvA
VISRLKGIVDTIGSESAVIDVNGVGYLVFASGRTLGKLALGEAAVVEVETHVREDHIHLYGFFDKAERDWFRLLTTVQGVGAKVGLAILGVLSPDELLRAVAAGDKAALGRASGVGPKLATRIASELKDKVGNLALGIVPGAAAASGPTTVAGEAPTAVADAASALVNLGYGPSEALGAVSRASGVLGAAASVEALIQGGLKELAAGAAR